MNLDRLTLERRVDRLLARYDGRGPGGTIGIVLDGEMAVHRSRGLASIEHRVPIGESTRFRIASVSKQFTCAAVLKLASERRLSTGDDIRTYLPELPDLGFISIDMILRNMSGIRDMLEIQRFGGMDLSVPCTGTELLAGICRQRSTNFPPGERFLYSNSNFLLAGLIVERVSGVSLPDYLDMHVFAPLGMNATKMTPQTSEIVPDLATGYIPDKKGGFTRAPHAFELGGEGGLVSCVHDLALWDRALTDGRADHAGLVAQESFTNGQVNRYARGLVIGTRRGVRTEDHGGSWPGFRTGFLRAPGIGATVICIINVGKDEAQPMALAALDAVIDVLHPAIHAVPAMPALSVLQPLAGRYLDAETPMTLEIAVSEAGEMTCSTFGSDSTVSAQQNGTLIAGRGAFARMLQPDGQDLITTLPSGHVQEFIRIGANAPLPAGLDGRYTNPDMAATLWISGDQAELSGPIVQGRARTLTGIDGDVLRIEMPSLLYSGWLDARALRDEAGHVTGLMVHGGRAQGVLFTRVS